MNEFPKYHKTNLIYKWKSRGVIYDNFDTLYQHYIDCKSCEWCGKVFEKNRERNLDHCHITGKFRLVVCQRCNCKDSYINYPDGYTEKEYREKNKDKLKEDGKEYREKNKDKLKEKQKEYEEKNRDKIKARKEAKYVCECGATIAKDSKSSHLKTIKHLSSKNL